MSTMTPCAKCRRLIYVGAFHTCPDSACYYHIPMSAQQRQASNHLAQPAQAVDVDYAPGELDSTAPERIWLQIDTNADNGDRSEPWPGTDGVTWQDESVGGLEIQYVRADLAASAISGEKAGPVDARSAALKLIAEASESYKAPAHLTLSKAEYVKAGARHFINHLNSALAASPTPNKEAKP